MDTKKIGALIAACRKEKGMTQAELGERLGVTNKTVSRWENGHYMPDLSLLEPLSKALGLFLEELLAGANGGTCVGVGLGHGRARCVASLAVPSAAQADCCRRCAGGGDSWELFVCGLQDGQYLRAVTADFSV